jgi:hypothetical protein
METAYHPDFGAKVAFTFERMPGDPEAQVRQSIAKAICLIRQDAQGEMIRSDAARALECGDAIRGTWNLVKPHIKFKQDADIAKDLELDDATKKEWNVGDDTVEVFIRPRDQSLLIALRGMGVEDCDGFTMYGACILTALGIPCALVTVAADGSRPTEFSHVYVVAYPNGPGTKPRIPLDFSHGSEIGWECPHHRIREWPVWETGLEKVTNVVTPVVVAGALYGLVRWFNRRAA